MGKKKPWKLCAQLILMFLALCNQAAPLLLNDDVLGLIVFKADLQAPESALRSWDENDDSPCQWTGITCSPQNGRVTEVILDGLSLSGRLGRGLARLQFINTLSLARNNLSGAITADVAGLPTLKKLDLSYNALSGPLPPAFSNASSLRYLDVSNNFLSGYIPAELFSGCNTLRYISLSRNRLQGPLPQSLGSCTRLQELHMSGNLLLGSLPVEMVVLSELRSLDLSYNLLSGNVPSFIGHMENLLDLQLQSNNLSGALPSQLGSCIHIVRLDVSRNSLSGEIPVALHQLMSLSVLNLQGNFFSGNIPVWIGLLSSLETLNMANNHFTGFLPLSLAQVPGLRVLSVSNNRLSGQIVAFYSNSTQLSTIDLSGNNFSGNFPEELLGFDQRPTPLSVSQLSAAQSVALSQCGSLSFLDISNNHFQGILPSKINNCVNLLYLNVSHNFFSGDIPVELSFLPSIQSLDLSYNQLTGVIPAGFGNSANLSVLRFTGNNLTGQIPTELGSCISLMDLSLSHNNITGSIPIGLGNLTDLEFLDLSFNSLSGSIPAEMGWLQNLTILNVSYNKLEGPVPNGGIFNRVNLTAFLGNEGLCGAEVNVTCPSVLPKPIVLNPNSTDNNPSDVNPLIMSRHRRIVLSPSAIVAISAAAAIALGVVLVTLLNIRSQTYPSSNTDMLDSISQSPSADVPIGKLVMFTNNSDPRCKEWVTSAHALLNKDSELGRGGFGTVYKAVLADGRVVAIKKLMVSSLVKSQEDFEKEVQLLGMIKHRNLLGLQGYYWTPQLQLLIYDYISNGNLYSHLHEKSQGDAPLCWSNRFKVALGTARGLAHLHHTCQPQIRHYNMKSSNVLLDENYNPKIADYGLANLLPMLDRYIMSTKFQSALGYMAPEFACQSLKINEKSDVYGFGVMLLELVTGRRPVEYMEDDVVILCDYVRSLVDEGKALACVDPRLQECLEDEILPVIKLGLVCTSQVPSNRPSMTEVVQILELIRTPPSSRDLP